MEREEKSGMILSLIGRISRKFKKRRKAMRNILFVASECYPFIKTGGLADVVGALPKSLNRSEFDVRVVIPKYMCIPWEYREKFHYVTSFYMDMGHMPDHVYVGSSQTMSDFAGTYNPVFSSVVEV